MLLIGTALIAAGVYVLDGTLGWVVYGAGALLTLAGLFTPSPPTSEGEK